MSAPLLDDDILRQLARAADPDADQVVADIVTSLRPRPGRSQLGGAPRAAYPKLMGADRE